MKIRQGRLWLEWFWKKITEKTKILYTQNRYLSYPLKRMLRNALNRPYYDFEYCSWYPNLSMLLKTKLQSTYNCCIRYCLGLKNRSHIRKNEFEKRNWLLVLNRVDPFLVIIAYDYENALSTKHMGNTYYIWMISTIYYYISLGIKQTLNKY